jgi:hypothetical protein
MTNSNTQIYFLKASTLVLMAVAAGMIVYTLVTDGSPFRKELLIPWMVATLVDFYTNLWFICLWVLYKEESWITGVIWIALLTCLGSPFTCLYVAIQLFKLKPNEPISSILLRKSEIPRRESTTEYYR